MGVHPSIVSPARKSADIRARRNPVRLKSSGDREVRAFIRGGEHQDARGEAVALMAEVVNGSTLRVGKDLRADLPELLWLYEMGVILYWVHDSSPGCAKTYALIDRTVPIVERLIGIAKLPVVRPMVRELVAMLAELRPDAAGAAPEVTGEYGAAGER